MVLRNEVISDNDTDISDYYDKLAFVNDWFLMGSPIPMALIIVAYLLFVLKIGPDYMKNRKPYVLQNTLLVYNAIQIAISSGLLFMCIGIVRNHGIMPRTCVMETDAHRRMITSSTYYYFIAKITELLDTVFFVLRKKSNQVSFLHVYHHALMVGVSWLALKYEPSYIPVFLGTFNSFVHVVMYTYYGLSAFPSLAKYLWWKKYITRLQLTQFVSILVHFAVMSMTSECKPSTTMVLIMVLNLFLFMYLFAKFYVNTYTKRNKDSKVQLNGENHNTGKYNNGIDNRDALIKETYPNETAYNNGDYKGVDANQAMKRKTNIIGNR